MIERRRLLGVGHGAAASLAMVRQWFVRGGLAYQGPAASFGGRLGCGAPLRPEWLAACGLPTGIILPELPADSGDFGGTRKETWKEFGAAARVPNF